MIQSQGQYRPAADFDLFYGLVQDGALAPAGAPDDEQQPFRAIAQPADKFHGFSPLNRRPEQLTADVLLPAGQDPAHVPAVGAVPEESSRGQAQRLEQLDELGGVKRDPQVIRSQAAEADRRERRGCSLEQEAGQSGISVDEVAFIWPPDFQSLQSPQGNLGRTVGASGEIVPARTQRLAAEHVLNERPYVR